MHSHVIKQFQTPAYHCYGFSLTQGQQDILGVLYISTLQDHPTEYHLSLALINVQNQACESIVIFTAKGPGNNVMSDMLLGYDAPQNRWVIMQLQGDDYLAFRSLTVRDDGSLRLSPLCLLDQGESEWGLNPLLGLEITDGTYGFLYHKPAFEHMTAALVSKLDVVLQPSVWDELEEEVVSYWSSYGSTPQIPIQEYLPEKAHYIDGNQTTALKIVSKANIAEAENALTYTDLPVRIAVLCSPETWVEPRMGPLVPLPPEEEQWRVWLTGWDRGWTSAQWIYAADIGLPIDPTVPSWHAPLAPTVHVAVIAGPSSPAHASGTIVAAIAMLKEDEVLSHGVCLDEQGQVVQVCTSPLGLRPSLCCCAQMVVGVDQLEGRWRLWNWSVFRQQKVQALVTLDASCQRAYVHAEPASGYFWLIEERQDGVCVSYRDASTLEEQAPATELPSVRLLPDQEEYRTLNGYRDMGILPYRDTLLLLAQSPEGELVLYQVEKSEEE
jgi:hypothetical protein